MILADLGRALATEVDKQIMVGTNANGQTLGLLNATGALSQSSRTRHPQVKSC